MNGIYTWQRGFPLTITAADLGGLNDTFGTNRADLVGDPSAVDQSVTQWFNTAAFAQPAAGALGTSAGIPERGPGVNNLDLALFKNFSVTLSIFASSSGWNRSTCSTTRSLPQCRRTWRQPTSAS